MDYVLQIVYCTTLQSSATKKIIPSYIKELGKQQKTIKSPTFQTTKTIPNFLTNIALLKRSSLTQKYHGKPKRNAGPTTLFPGDCNLCLNEKLKILDDEDQKLLNKQSEIISHFRHQNNFKLKFLAPNTGDTDIT